MRAAAGAIAVIFAAGCGDCGRAPVGFDMGVDTGVPPETDSAIDSGTDTAVPTGPVSYRAYDFQILIPMTLRIINGQLTLDIAAEEINLLMRVSNLAVSNPILEVGEGKPTANPGEFSFVGSTVLLASFDAAASNLVTTSAGSLTITLGSDTDGDGAYDVFAPLILQSIAGQPLLDLFFSSDYSTVASTSSLFGALAVDDACAVDIDLGGGAQINLLDILDGNLGMTNPPDTTPPCAAGDGPNNFPPDIDLDGDGTDDAYRVGALLAADTVVIP